MVSWLAARSSSGARVAALLVLLSLTWPAAAPAVEPAAAHHPGWAEPLQYGEGLPNLYRVSHDLLRGAQPTKKGFGALRRLGVRTVINVRTGRHEATVCERNGLRYVEIPMRAWSFEQDDVVRFLEVAASPDHAPVFVHCRRGADRTGMLVAVYRVAVLGWSKEDALEEMTHGPYGYNPAWKKLVYFVEDMDVAQLRRAAGLDATDDIGSER